MKRDENKKNPSSVLGSGAEGGFDSEGAAALYDELMANELGQELYGQRDFEGEDGQSAEVTDPFYDLPLEVMQEIGKNLDFSSIVPLLKASPAWREERLLDNLNPPLAVPSEMNFQEFLDYIRLRAIDAPWPSRSRFGEPNQRYPYRGSLAFKNSDELRQFADMAKMGKVFPDARTGKKKSVLGFLGNRPMLRVENDEEYKKSANPHHVFRNVCRSLDVLRGVIRDLINPDLDLESRDGMVRVRAVFPDLYLSSAYCLPDLYDTGVLDLIASKRVNNLIIPQPENAEGLASLHNPFVTRASVVNNIVTPPIPVTIKNEPGASEKEVLDDASRQAQEYFVGILKLIEQFHGIGRWSKIVLVIDPTVLYRDNSSGQNKFVDIDPKRETLINVIRGDIVMSPDFVGSNVRILAPRSAAEVSASMGGLAKNEDVAPAPLPLACQKSWREFKDSLESTPCPDRRLFGTSVAFDERFPAGARGVVNFPDRAFLRPAVRGGAEARARAFPHRDGRGRGGDGDGGLGRQGFRL